MINFFKKNKNESQPAAQNAPTIEDLKLLADSFLNQNSIEISEEKIRQKISPIKWLYPGYGDFSYHAISPKKNGRSASEMINQAKFVNDFLQNRRDVEGRFAYFIVRIESNYIKVALIAQQLFDIIIKADPDDADTIILIKQTKRLLPKFNIETLQVDIKHIEVFGEIFNKLKAIFAANPGQSAAEKQEFLTIDIPTYSSTAIQIDNSLQSYNILRLSQILEKLCQDSLSVSLSDAKSIIQAAHHDTEKVKESLFGSQNSKRYFMSIENLEKITYKLAEMEGILTQLTRKP